VVVAVLVIEYDTGGSKRKKRGRGREKGSSHWWEPLNQSETASKALVEGADAV
jgi:hypothetical protein